jgi:hypothetical protein
MSYHVIECKHVRLCGSKGYVEDEYPYQHHKHDVDVCQDYDYQEHSASEVLDALGYEQTETGWLIEEVDA